MAILTLEPFANKIKPRPLFMLVSGVAIDFEEVILLAFLNIPLVHYAKFTTSKVLVKGLYRVCIQK